MKRIILSSLNPVKQIAALQGFQEMFPGEVFLIEGIQVESGVSSQPMTDQETYQGALNRARRARQTLPDGDFWVGIEGGCRIKMGNLRSSPGL